MWPEFGAADLGAALAEFTRRNRTFGMVPGEPPGPEPQLLGAGVAGG